MNEFSQYDKDTLAYLEAVGVKGVLLKRVRELVEEVTAARAEDDR